MNDTFQFLICRSAKQNASGNAITRSETVWLIRMAMAKIVGVEVSAVSKHLSNIFAGGDLYAAGTVSKMEIVTSGGGPKGEEVPRFLQPRRHYFR